MAEDAALEERLAAAFAAIPRVDFLPARQRGLAGQDRPIPIGHGQTNSQPTTVRRMLGLLDPQPGHRVLDVGSGSGWTVALLGHLVTDAGQVVGVERISELVEFGRTNLATHPMPWTEIRPADDEHLGRPQTAPYDRILVSAEATELPDELVDQLGPDARMVIPVAGRLSLVDRDSVGRVAVARIGHYAFVPLR